MADDLEFQDLPYEESTGKNARSSSPQTHTFNDFPPSAVEEENDEENEEKHPSEQKSGASYFSLAFYQQYFDVDTYQVGSRMLGSMIPNPKQNYLEHAIRPSPDLYGPFWICATLTFTIAMAGNVAGFLTTMDAHWSYNFSKVPSAATGVFGYWLIIPLIIWGVLKWRGSLAGYTLIEIICVYGYSLSIFVPISILWAIPFQWVQWTLVILGSVLSGVTLLITFWPAVKNDDKKVAVGVLVIIIILHGALAAGFLLWFFPYSTTAVVTTTAPTVASVVSDIPVSKKAQSTGSGGEAVESQVKGSHKNQPDPNPPERSAVAPVQSRDQTPDDENKKMISGLPDHTNSQSKHE